MTQLRTERLLLRQWRLSDREPFAALNADPIVMEYFPSTLDREQSDEFVDRMHAHLEEHGWGLWAVEEVETENFIGFVGLWPAGFEPFREKETIEIGWRLARSAWGRGLATEAAMAVLRHAFDVLGLDQLVSVTTSTNQRSRAVMERIGMSRDVSSDFDHHRLPEGHPLRPHVVYRIDAMDLGGTIDGVGPPEGGGQ